MGKGAKSPNEFEIIARYFAPLAAREPGALGLLDDAAVLAISADRKLVITTDTLVEGIHFMGDDPPESLAGKLLAVNLSDLAAMGSEPFAYTLSLALPKAWSPQRLEDWLSGFCAGLRKAQEQPGVTLVGGDTVGTPGPLCLTATALGTAEPGRELLRSGALPGDVVYLSGTLGDAALGLRVLRNQLPGVDPTDGEALIRRYRMPEPRVALGLRLAGIAHGVADVSDGLVADLSHICSASGVLATIHTDWLPLSKATVDVLARDPTLLASVLAGGDDYELVFTAAPEASVDIGRISRDLALPLTAIGRIDAAEPGHRNQLVRVVDALGREVDVIDGGFRHF
jgi:thiamine-monophosphate kinase